MMAAPAAWLTEFGFMGQAAAFKAQFSGRRHQPPASKTG
jgi:hypothetical protein